jgi:DNA polymerase-3 subunit gamma/tau
LWKQLLAGASKASPFTQTYFQRAQPVSFEKGMFVVGLSGEHLALVDNQRNHEMLAEQIKALGHEGVQFRFVDDPPPEDSAPEPVLEPIGDLPEPEPAAEVEAASSPKAKREPKPEQINPDDFKNDPLIQKALELFKGRIVEVRK